MRASGVLLPIFSLPGDYGIGTFGKEAYRFVDFLKKAGQTYWQILPLSPTGFGDSPYQSPSAYAGNPYFIDFDVLCEDGLLTKEDYASVDWGDPHRIDYALLYQKRYAVLRKAFSRFAGNEPSDYSLFYEEARPWLDDYALFTALKNAHDGRGWNEWEEPLRLREPAALSEARRLYADEIAFQIAVQYWFTRQWADIKHYANENGIKIIGDIPIYVAYDSADVWSEPQQFLLDADGVPTEVAGCPPDAFTKEGQLWGNPLYNWSQMKNGVPPYHWWRRRISFMMDMYDVIRIDHFRGFEAYYAVPYGSANAVRGVWRKGPDTDLFDCLKDGFGKLPVIAEDLGFLTDDVRKMLKKTGFPGMKVLQFAFDSDDDSDYLPHHIGKNSVVYTGTHDNDTCVGWAKALSVEDREFAEKYMHISPDETINWAMIRTCYATAADTAIVPIQEFLGLGSEARLNTPSTLGGNWQWRIDSGCINDWLAGIIYRLCDLYRRVPKQKEKKDDSEIVTQ